MKTNIKMLIALILLRCILTAPAAAADISDCSGQPKAVSFVDVNRFMGTWYEIARMPSWFEKGSLAVVAECDLRDNGKITISNSYRNNAFDAPLQTAKGRAWICDTASNAKLKVSFFWPFSDEYWIVDLDNNYEFVALGNPERTAVWIMSRTPVMTKSVLGQILARLERQGYNVSKLEMTPHKLIEQCNAAGR